MRQKTPISAPYNFVPLSDWVYEPDWAPYATQDVPFRDGLCGYLTLDIEAVSPLLIGGKRTSKKVAANNRTLDVPVVNPFSLGGTYAIPSSSLKGMLRSLIEVITFGRFHNVDDKRYGIRDLSGPSKYIYRTRINDNVQAGYMQMDGDGNIKIYSCSWAKIHRKELEKLNRSYRVQDSIQVKYKKFQDVNLSLRLNNRGKVQVTHNNDPEMLDGMLVFSGGAPKKSHEFFFYDDPELENDYVYNVPPEVFTAFRDLQEPEDGRPTNPAWIFTEKKPNEAKAFGKGLKDAFEQGQTIPVFFTLDSGYQIDSIGLACMFKIPHKLSTHEMVKNTSVKHLDEKRLDFATALFGAKNEQDGVGWSMKGRVNFDAALVVDNARVNQNYPRTVLLGPKPSFFPAYVEQPVNKNDPGFLKNNGSYASYTPLKDQKDAEIRKPKLRGIKRYPARMVSEINLTEPPEKGGDKVQVILQPLETGTRFKTCLRFHNLRPMELGALIWALTWGNDKRLHHSIGMAKPFGFGQISVSLSTDDYDIRANDAKQQSEVKKPEDYAESFVAHMDGIYKKQTRNDKGWLSSPQLTELMAMADPENFSKEKCHYMGMEDFRSAKNDRAVLQRYSDMARKGK